MTPALRNLRFLLLPVCLVLVGACAVRPQPLAGDFPDFQPDQATQRSVGARVRWGGTVVETRPQSGQTCLEILAMDLARDYRPLYSDDARGRFIACKQDFLEPETFRPGRQVTVIGRLDEFSTGNVGEYQYRYPRVDAETVYLWPEGPDYGRYPADVYYVTPWPYYHGFYPYYFHHPHFIPVRPLPPRVRPHGKRPVTLSEAARRARDN